MTELVLTVLCVTVFVWVVLPKIKQWLWAERIIRAHRRKTTPRQP